GRVDGTGRGDQQLISETIAQNIFRDQKASCQISTKTIVITVRTIRLKMIASGARLTSEHVLKSGKCGLCHNEALLVNSHLLPRALYKSLRNIDPDDENPLFLNRDVFLRTSTQISDYL